MSPAPILVADEDMDTRIILRTLLARHGYTIIEAATGRAAMEAATQQPLSLVILNYPMRVSDAVTLSAWLRQQSATSSVPIINLMSRAVPLLMEEAAREGVTVTLPKPRDMYHLLELVRELCQPPMVAH